MPVAPGRIYNPMPGHHLVRVEDKLAVAKAAAAIQSTSETTPNSADQ
jgi:hypothetical protein